MSQSVVFTHLTSQIPLCRTFDGFSFSLFLKCIQYILIVLFSLTNSQILYACLSTQFYDLSLSPHNSFWKFKEKKTNKIKKYQNKIKCPQKAMEYVLCWPTTPGHRACFGVWLLNLVILHWRKLISLFPGNIDYNRFLFKGRTSCLLFLLSVGILAELNFYRSCVFCQNLHDFICLLILVWLRHALFLEWSTTSSP